MLLRDARLAPQKLLYAPEPKREPREFTIAWSREMSLKRGKGAGSFVGETKAQATDFYRLVLQTLKPWVAVAPKLRTTLDPGLPLEGTDLRPGPAGVPPS
jgi:hypothetical protein